MLPIMTAATALKLVVPGGAALIAQTVIDPLNPGIVERVGTAGVVVAGAYFIVKYFMAQIEKKDARLDGVQTAYVNAVQAMFTQQIAANAAHTAMVVDELRASRAVGEKLIDTLDALTTKPH
jgi:hypothetical protein